MTRSKCCRKILSRELNAQRLSDQPQAATGHQANQLQADKTQAWNSSDKQTQATGHQSNILTTKCKPILCSSITLSKQCVLLKA